MDQQLNSFSTKLISELTFFCKDYFNECLHRKNGYNIIYLIDTDNAKFGCYISTNHELGELVDYELSRDEIIGKIVHVTECSKFRNYNKSEINEMAYNMAFYLFGVICSLNLVTEFKLDNDTEKFISELK